MTDDRIAALKARVYNATDDRVNGVIDSTRDAQTRPELGYGEVKTIEKVASLFENPGPNVEMELVITDARTRARSGNFVVVVLDKLDTLVNPDHPMADPGTGAVHTCGHNAQLTNLVGTTFGFVGGDVVDDLDGAVEFVAVSAEEYLNLDYRRGLFDADDIELFGDKQELIRRGYADGWDAVAMMYAGSDTPEQAIMSDLSADGSVGRFVIYRRTGAHAGTAPEEGVNALNAAMLGMNAVHAQRERFRDEDHVHIHPAITRGGDGANAVPAEVTMELYVRAASVKAIVGASESVNRAPASGAIGVGGDVGAEDYLGYMPLQIDEAIVAFYDKNARDIVGPDMVMLGTPHLSESTNMGDIMQFTPGIRPWTGDFEGAVHTRDLRVVDEETAYAIPVELTACTLADLLTSPETTAAVREVKAEKRNREEYLGAVW